MFGCRIGVYLIPVLLSWAAQASEVNPFTFIAADFAAFSHDGEINPAVVKAQVLLDRANISSGEINGKISPRFDEAIAAFAEIHDLPADTGWSRPFWDELTAGAIVPVLTGYSITSEDLKGPFVQLPARLEDMTSFKTLGYANIREALAEKFHMSTELLARLNPDASFSEAGEVIIVANVLNANKAPNASRIDVDKDRQTVKVYSSRNELIAFFPASIGSDAKPTPSGTLKVTTINSDPTFHYNPKYQFKEVETRKPFDLSPGPNNPLGSTWIALSKPSYGIHGTPEPSLVGKASSHGCVRLTNWDAQRLAAMLSRGIAVNFIEKPDENFTAY
jgi:lipoprotein-anchoring transpeptidase ErfK/SrfK